MPQKVYLDDHGNPIASKVYLDDNGEPISPKVEAKKEAPAPFKSESGFRGIEATMDAVRAIPDVARNLFGSSSWSLSKDGKREYATGSAAGTAHGAGEGIKAAGRDFVAAGKSELGGAKDMAEGVAGMVRHPVDTAENLGQGFVDAGKAIPDIVRNTVGPSATAETRKATAKGAGIGLGEGLSGTSADQAQADPLRAIGGTLAMVAGAKVAGSAGAAGKRIMAGRTAAAAEAAAKQAAEKAAMARVAVGLGGDVQPEAVAEGLAGGQRPVPGSRLVKPTPTTPTAIAQDALAELGKPELAPGVELPVNEAQPDVTHPTIARPVVTLKPAPKPVPGARLVKANRQSLEETLAKELAAGDQTAVPPPVELPPPPFSLGESAPPRQPRVSVAGSKRAPKPPVEPPVEPQAAPEVPPAAPVEAPAEAVAPKVPGVPAVSRDGQSVVVRPKPGVVQELRSVGGARRAAQELGISEDDVRRLAPGPSRRPMMVDLAEDDANYRRRLADERGAVDPKLLAKIGIPIAGAAAGSALDDGNPVGGAILGGTAGLVASNPGAAMRRFQELRAMGMLSGGALPKSALGNVGAIINAALEGGPEAGYPRTAPIREALRVPTNAGKAVSAFKAQTAPGGTMTSGAQVQGLGRLNLPGRIMGALDETTEAAMERAGVPSDRARQLQLMEQNPAGGGTNALQRGFNTRAGRFMVPFQRVPLNQWAQGVESLDGMLPRGERAPNIHNSTRGRAITAGTIAGGAVAGDKTQDPLTLAMLAALAGPRAIPFALGAGGMVAAKHSPTAAKSLLERVGVGLPEGSTSDLINPIRAIDKPALIRFLEQMRGQ